MTAQVEELETIDWDSYWSLPDPFIPYDPLDTSKWVRARFDNYRWDSAAQAWAKLPGQTLLTVTPQIDLCEFGSSGTCKAWMMHFLKPAGCPECYWGPGGDANTRVYMTSDGGYYRLLGESHVSAGGGADALYEGLGLNGEGVHNPPTTPYLRNFCRITQEDPAWLPYIASPAGTAAYDVSADDCRFWDTGVYEHRYHMFEEVADNQPSVNQALFRGRAKIPPAPGNTKYRTFVGKWQAGAHWLGHYTLIPGLEGKTILLRFYEPGYKVEEHWALMQGIGLVQVEQWYHDFDTRDRYPIVRMTVLEYIG